MFGYHPQLGHHPSAQHGSMVDLTSKVIQLTLLVASLTAAMFLNGLVTYCLARKRRFAASAGNQFLFSLTLSNFINAIFSLPMLIAAGASDTWSWGTFSCQTSAFVHLLVGVNGNLTLAMIAYDRYHAIVKPLKYHQQISAGRSLCMLIGGWIFSILVTASPLWGWSSFGYHPSLFVCGISWKHHPVFALVLFIGVVFIPMVIMVVFYTYVYVAARFQQYSIGHQFSAATKDLNEANGGQAAAEDPLLKGSPIRLKHKLPWVVVTYSSPDKARRTLLLLLSSYSVCWVAMLVWASCDIAGTSSNTLAFVCYFINSLSAVANPLIYGFMNKSIRKLITKMVCQRQIGRRGTGGRKRRKRSKAINLIPPSRSASPNSSPLHSGHNSLASFFDYCPKQGAGVQGTEQENSPHDSQPSAGIDSYDIIRLWSRKFNPFGTRSPIPQRPNRGNAGERHSSRNDWRPGPTRAASEPYFEKAMRDACDDLSDVDMELLSPQRQTKFRVGPKKRGGNDGLFEYRDDAMNRTVLVDEDDSNLLSPKTPGSRLSSVTQFTDVPPYESSNCASSDDERCDDV